MPDPSTDTLTIQLPDGLAPSGAPNTLTLHVAVDKNKRRLLNRSFRDANASDAGRIRTVEWEFGGLPIGRSQESTSGNLGINVVRNLETRWGRQLTSALQQILVDLTGHDPPGIDGSLFGVSIFGTSYFGSPIGGGSSGDGPDVSVFAEMQGYLFVARGQLLTQVSLATWAVVSTTVLTAPILDMDFWQGNVYIALGSNEPMQRIVTALVTGPVLESVTAASPSGLVYASTIKVGSDRAWYIDADQLGSTFGLIGYTLDAFVTLAFPFQVGDPMNGMNGLGPFNSLLGVGEGNGIWTSTDQGKSVILSRALNSLRSPLNGSQFADPGFGWNYYLAVTGLRAHTFTGVDNPVGIGPAMRNFTGHNGLATAVFAALGELLVVFQTTDGDLYGYRGLFDPQRTGNTGQPALFPWFFAEAEACKALFSSTTPNAPIETTQEVTLIRGSGTNLKHQTVAANEMDNLAPDLTYSTGGGTAYLTMLDRNANLLKNLRLVRTRDVNLTTGSSWDVAFGFDTDPNDPTGATYISVGTIDSNGAQTILPITGVVDAQGNPTPTLGIFGRTIAPAISQTALGAGAATNPPTLLGTLEVEIDERPEQIEVIEGTFEITERDISSNQTWEYLRELVGPTTHGPYKAQLPDDLTPAVTGSSGGGQKYVMIQSVKARTDISAETKSVDIVLEVWPAAEALSLT